MSLSPALKLMAGVSATLIVARAGTGWYGQSLMADLGARAGAVMAAHGVTDGAVRWTDAGGRASRTALLSGTADAATRAAVVEQVRAAEGIADAHWTER